MEDPVSVNFNELRFVALHLPQNLISNRDLPYIGCKCISKGDVWNITKDTGAHTTGF
jgi:hypothetical protein